MSFFTDYYKEREGLETLKHKHGFATFIIEEDICFIKDIFVEKDFRKKSIASEMADEIVKLAKERNCKTLLGQADIGANGAEASVLTLLHYGFKFHRMDGNIIAFYKEL